MWIPIPETKVADPEGPDRAGSTEMSGHVPVGLQPQLVAPVGRNPLFLVLLDDRLGSVHALPIIMYFNQYGTGILNYVPVPYHTVRK